MDTQELMGEEIFPSAPPTQDEKTMALLAHILCLVGWFIAPLVIYLIKKDESNFVMDHAKESLNFQITIGIAYVICFILMFVIIGVFLMGLLSLISLILIIVATLKASEGKIYRYPFNLRLIK